MSDEQKGQRRKGDRLTSGVVLTALIGGMFLLGGGWLFIEEVRAAEKHTSHLSLAFGAAIFGALMIRPDPVTDRLKRMAGVLRSVWKPGSSGPTGNFPTGG